MAGGAKQELVSYLGGRVAEILADLSAVREDMATWARLDAEVRNRRNQVFKIAGDAQANAAEFEANLAALRVALAGIAGRVRGAVARPGKEYILALINEWNKNNLPEQVAAAIRVYPEIIGLVRRYKNRLPPETDLRAVVEEALVEPVAAVAQFWFETDELFRPFQEHPRAITAVAALASELRSLFRINLLEAEPALFESNAAITGRLNGEIGELSSQVDDARGRVVQALSDMAAVIAHLAEVRGELKPEEIRDAVQRSLIAPLKAAPGNCFQEGDVPEELRKLRPYVKFDAQAIGDEVAQRILEQLRQSLPEVFTAEQPASHPCGAPCRTQDGRCHRRTTEEYCYQHGEAPADDALPLAGKWRMSGVQTGLEHSGWEAELVLDKSGAARWKQTRGANASASRSGRWQWGKGLFLLVYRAPHTGRVEWEAHVSSPEVAGMGGEYRTPEVSPAGMGWGGTWSASRAS